MEKVSLDLLITVRDDVAGLMRTLTALEEQSSEFNIFVYIKCTDAQYLHNFNASSFPNLRIQLFERQDLGIYYGMNDAIFFYSRYREENRLGHSYWSFINTGDTIDLRVLKNLIEESHFPNLICAGIQFVRPDSSFGRVLLPSLCNKSWARFFGAKPGHMSFYLKQDVEPKTFDTRYKIAADYKWMLEYLIEIEKNSGSVITSRNITCFMSLGGASTGSLKKFILGQKESFLIRLRLFGLVSAIFGILKPIWGLLWLA